MGSLQRHRSCKGPQPLQLNIHVNVAPLSISIKHKQIALVLCVTVICNICLILVISWFFLFKAVSGGGLWCFHGGVMVFLISIFFLSFAKFLTSFCYSPISTLPNPYPSVPWSFFFHFNSCPRPLCSSFFVSSPTATNKLGILISNKLGKY